MPMNLTKLETTGGHITPVSSFYLAFKLLTTKFKNIKYYVDKYQNSSLVAFIALCIPISIFGKMHFNKEKTKYQTIDNENSPHVQQMNSIKLLLGRTLIMLSRK